MIDPELPVASQLASEYAGQIFIVLLQAIVVLLLLIFVQITLTRTMNTYRNHRKEIFLKKWRPVFAKTAVGEFEDIPVLTKREVDFFALEWIELYEKMFGTAQEYLIVLGESVKLGENLRHLLHGRQTKKQMLAVVTLGHLRDAAAWDDLVRLAKVEDTVLSLAAFRSAVKIDAQTALEHFVDDMATRKDWPPALVARVLRETDGGKICNVLNEYVKNLDDERLNRILLFMGVVQCPSVNPLAKEVMERSDDSQVLATCLSIVSDPSLIELAKRYTRYPVWYVRKNAYELIGRIGSKNDLDALVEGLSDSEWWVRYRSAQALANFPMLSHQDLDKISDGLYDLFAKDILRQAIAERELS